MRISDWSSDVCSSDLFTRTEDARAAHKLAGKLHRQDVSSLLERGYELIAQTRMRPFHTISALGQYLRLLQGIRDSTHRFSPTVFERPLLDRKTVVSGKGVPVRVDLGGCRSIKKKSRSILVDPDPT